MSIMPRFFTGSLKSYFNSSWLQGEKRYVKIFAKGCKGGLNHLLLLRMWRGGEVLFAVQDKYHM